jgi:hypothetical protein
VGNLSVPTSRLRGERFTTAVPERVVQAANVVEINLQSA